jgi:hypothetical protein
MNGLRGSMLAVHGAGVAALVLLTAAGATLVVRPALRLGDEARTTAAGIAQRDAELREAARANAEAERLVTRLNAELAQAVTLLPATMLNQRLAELSGLCEARGVVVREIRPGASSEGRQHVRVSVKIAGLATWAEGVGLMDDLATRYRDTAVTGFRLRGDPLRPGERSEYELDLVWHAAREGLAGAPTTP